jgi:predicted O-methyltransferase YrrM
MSGLTIVPPDRCRSLHSLASSIRNLNGQMAEVGVYKGGTALMLAELMPAKTLYAFDTFSGMPGTAGSRDVHRAGDFADTSLEAVRGRLKAYPNVEFRRGLFPGTAVGLEREFFCLAHFDGDLYQSCRDFIAFFWPRLVPGGLLVFDDWKWKGCPGVRTAIEEAGLPVAETALYQAAALKT